MLKELQSGGTDITENERLLKSLVGLMEQLTNKDISFEPMQELYNKFPTWMHKNENSVKLKDLKKYRVKQRPVCAIAEKSKWKEYSYSNRADKEFTVW